MGPDYHGHRALLGVPLISLFLESFARLAVWCALSSYSSHKGQASSHQKKRHREDIEVGDPSVHLFTGLLCRHSLSLFW